MAQPQISRSATHNNGLMQMIAQIPPITRALLSGIVVLSVLCRIGILPSRFLIFSSYHTFMKLQLWRMYTSCLLLPNQAMPALIEMYNVYARSSQLELNHFQNRKVDYLFYLTFSILTIVLSVMLLQIMDASNLLGGLVQIQFGLVLTNAFVGCLTYTWSVDNRNTRVMFYGLFPIWGRYFPIIQLFISFLFDDSGFGFTNFVITLIGFSTGYFYSCLDTRSLGPIYGYLASKPSGYGYVAAGQFRAPWWFVGLCDLAFGNSNTQDRYRVNVPFGKQREYHGKGQRLGTTRAQTAERIQIENPRTRIAEPERNTTSGFFPGKGQRVGSKKNE